MATINCMEGMERMVLLSLIAHRTKINHGVYSMMPNRGDIKTACRVTYHIGLQRLVFILSVLIKSISFTLSITLDVCNWRPDLPSYKYRFKFCKFCGEALYL